MRAVDVGGILVWAGVLIALLGTVRAVRLFIKRGFILDLVVSIAYAGGYTLMTIGVFMRSVTYAGIIFLCVVLANLYGTVRLVRKSRR